MQKKEEKNIHTSLQKIIKHYKHAASLFLEIHSARYEDHFINPSGKLKGCSDNQKVVCTSKSKRNKKRN